LDRNIQDLPGKKKKISCRILEVYWEDFHLGQSSLSSLRSKELSALPELLE